MNRVAAFVRRHAWIAIGVALLTVIAREMGWVTLELHHSWQQDSMTTNATRLTTANTPPPPRPRSAPLVDRNGLTIYGPGGEFGATILSMLPQLPAVTGHIEVQVDPPLAWLPLWKHAGVSAKLVGALALQRGDGKPPVTSVLNAELDGTWNSVGPMARRSFLLRIAQDLGTRFGNALQQEVEQMRAQ